MCRTTLRLVVVFSLAALAQHVLAAGFTILDEKFSEGTDPLTYLYQDEGVSHDSFYYSGANGNIGGEARRGLNGWNDNPDLILSTAERATVAFSCAGYGDADEYLEYTEDFDFSFDVKFSSFAASGDEALFLGLWYLPEDAMEDHAVIYRAWGNRQHFVGVRITENGSDVRLYLIHQNGADWSGKSRTDDLTDFGPNAIGSLSTGTNYRVEGHYRWDGSTYGQIFGRLINLDTGVTIGDIPQEMITQDEPDIYSVGYNNMNVDSDNHRFTQLRLMGVGNETWGATRNPGPHFTSDNWKLDVYDPVELVSINVAPPNNAVYLGETARLTCEGYDAVGTHYNVTDWVQWESLDPATVSIDDENYIATGHAVGSTSIRATFGALETPLVPFEVLPERTPHDTALGLDILLQWRSLPKLKPGTEAGMASSYYRSFSVYNTTGDLNCYDSHPYRASGDVDPVVVRELTGPGMITRTWMPWLPGPEFKLKLYFDGETSPRIDTTTLKWYDEGVPGHPAIRPPLVGTGTGGAWGYTPLYFADSLRIESNNVTGANNFYQINYLLLPEETEVETYTAIQGSSYWADWNRVGEILDNVGENPGPAGPKIISASGVVNAGSTLDVAELTTGQGVITRLQIKLDDPTDMQLAGMKLRVFYDGNDDPAIDVSVGEFFGAGRGRIAYSALALGTDGPDGYYCYIPMPFRHGFRVEMANDSSEQVTVTSAEVEYEPQPVGKDQGYLHALYHDEQFAIDEDRMYPVADIPDGSGHFLGYIMTVTPDGTSLNYLEGNDRIVVDGGTRQTEYGTGMEDAFNGGYYYTVPYGGPFSGMLKKDNGMTSQYRHMIMDPVPFEQSILVEFQGVDISYWGDHCARHYESTAYWYQKVAGPPVLEISMTGEDSYHLSWDEAGDYDLEVDTSPDFASPTTTDVTGLMEWNHATAESEAFFRLRAR